MADFGKPDNDDIFEHDAGGGSEDVVDHQDPGDPNPPSTGSADSAGGAQGVSDDGGGEPAGQQKDANAEAQAAAEAARKAEAEKANPAASAPEGYVPSEALRQARSETAQLKGQVDELNRRLSVVDGLKSQLDEYRQSSRKAAEEAADPAPDKEKDPLGYVEWENRQLRKDIDALKNVHQEQEDNTKAATEEQERVQTLMRTVRTQVNEFEQTTPDYSQAFKFVHAKRMKEYEAIGIPPEERSMAFDREVMALAVNALQRYQNPGEAMYKLAQAQGYTKTGAKTDTTGKGDGKDQTLEQTMEAINKGQGAGSMGAGGQTNSEPTVEEVMNMNDEAFDAWWSKNVGSPSIY